MLYNSPKPLSWLINLRICHSPETNKKVYNYFDHNFKKRIMSISKKRTYFKNNNIKRKSEKMLCLKDLTENGTSVKITKLKMMKSNHFIGDVNYIYKHRTIKGKDIIIRSHGYFQNSKGGNDDIENSTKLFN